MKHVRSTLLASLAVPALLLTACGGDDPVVTPAAPSPSSASEAPASSSSAAAAAAPAAATGTTAPGTELKIGQRAVVPFTYGTDTSGTIAITVTAIEQGDPADLAKFGDKAKGITPFYLRATIENVDGSDLAYTSVSLRGTGPGGRSTGVIISGETDRCESGSAGKDFSKAGAKYDTCVLTAASTGSSVTEAAYNKADAYEDSPVVWKN